MGVPDPHHVTASAASLEGDEPVPGAHIREEVAEPVGPTSRPLVGDHLRLGIEALLADQVRTGIGMPEEEVGVRQQLHRQGEGVVVEEACTAVTLRAAELVVVVPGKEEKAVLLPLERSGCSTLGPDRGEAAPIGHIHELIEGHPHRRRGLPCRDFRDADLGDPLLAGELTEGGEALPLLPPSELDRADVLNVVAGEDRDAGGGDPLVIDPGPRPLIRCRCHGRRAR